MKVLLNSPGYSYDVHSLVKAFFPEEDVEVISFDDAADRNDSICVSVSSGDIPDGVIRSGTICVSAPGENGDMRFEEEYHDMCRPQVKNQLKRVLYNMLTELSGRTLPWGTMTGIRPTKVPMKMICEGCDDELISDHMRSEYLCSKEKIDLATKIAHREKSITDSIKEDGFSLYIGIPFCPTTCMYCSFTSYPIASWKDRVDEYIRALKKELDFFKAYYDGRCPDSIYIGGGTPTTLLPQQLEDLIMSVKERFDTSSLREFTVEAGRPDSITDDKLRVLKNMGVDRISINPQTMNDKTLKIIGRAHSVADVYKAYDTARSAGFDNINMDLIMGLPGEDEDDVAVTLDKVGKLSPDSLTIHSMAIKRAAGMARFLSEHSDIASVNTPHMMEMAHDCASALGLVPYYLYRQKNMAGNFENVGYAREGKFGIYNIAIMEEVCDIAAVGAGTISKRIFADNRIERCDNVKDVALYIDRIDDMIDKKAKLFDKGE